MLQIPRGRPLIGWLCGAYGVPSELAVLLVGDSERQTKENVDLFIETLENFHQNYEYYTRYIPAPQQKYLKQYDLDGQMFTIEQLMEYTGLSIGGVYSRMKRLNINTEAKITGWKKDALLEPTDQQKGVREYHRKKRQARKQRELDKMDNL